jgi:Tol biopolymer transport system component
MSAIRSGERVGPYEVVSPLGAGGMGEVYRARDPRLGRDVAIKALPSEFATDSERLARFGREARLLAALNHPNVAAIHGMEEREGRTFLVLELVPGETLAARLAAGPLPVAEALRIGIEIAAGLAAAHEAGVIHRDLKPGNVMLRPDGSVKVLDFGLAKVSGRASTSGESHSPTVSLGTQTGTILGTAAYMSPEQARGRAVDERSDIFAFGCVLYECLTGRRAFPGENVSDTLGAILSDEPDWTLLPPDTPPRAAEVLRRCLQKDPRRRFHSASDVRLDLEEALSPSSLSLPRATPAERRRRRLGWILGGVIAAAAAAAGFLAAALLMRPRPQTPIPGLRAVLPLPEGIRVALTEQPSVALSPDGSTLVFRGEQGGTIRLYRRRLDSSDTVPIQGTEGASEVFFSPDGEWIGFFRRSQLEKIPVRGGTAIPLAMLPPIAQGASWGADGSIVISALRNSGLSRVSEKGGELAPATQLDAARSEHAHAWPQVLPRGRGILATIIRGRDFQDLDSAEVAVLEPGSERRRVVLEGSTFARYVEDGYLVFVRGESVLSVPFDLDSLRTTGPEVPLSDVAVMFDQGTAQIASGRGVLVSADGPADRSGNIAVLSVTREGHESILPLPPGQYLSPRLSPDGRRIAVAQWQRLIGRIAVFDRDRQVLSTVTPEPGRFFCPAWSPEGTRLAFSVYFEGEPHLGWKPIDGSLPIQDPLKGDHTPTFPSSWSPDGKSIAYTNAFAGGGSRTAHGRSDVMLVSADGSGTPRALMAGPASEIAPNFSPDGRWLLYVSDESGTWEVYVAAFPGPGPKIKISAEGGSEPAWTSGGREVIYRKGEQFLSAAFSSGPPPSAGRPVPLFSGPYGRMSRMDHPRQYDVSADGKEFIVIRGDNPPQIARQLVVRTGLAPGGRIASAP